MRTNQIASNARNALNDLITQYEENIQSCELSMNGFEKEILRLKEINEELGNKLSEKNETISELRERIEYLENVREGLQIEINRLDNK